MCPDVVLGDHDRLEDLRRVATGAHALTFDHEGVPTEHLLQLQSEGVTVNPPPQALLYAQDKLAMRHRLAELGAPVPGFAEITAAADVALTSIYSNFPGGKADLYAVLACRVGSEHVAAMEAAVAAMLLLTAACFVITYALGL